MLTSMYSVRQIKWCHQNNLLTSSLERGDPPWMGKGSWKITRSTFVNFLATEKCDISILMYIARQIKWCGHNYLWKSSLVSERYWLSLICIIESTLWLTDKRFFFNTDYGQAGHLSNNIWSRNSTFRLLSSLRNLYKTHDKYDGSCRTQEPPPKSGRVSEGLPDLLLYIFYHSGE